MGHNSGHAEQVTGTVFQSELGWMAIRWQDEQLSRLAFGFSSQAAARQSFPAFSRHSTSLTPAMENLVVRLQEYAAGAPDDFLDIPVEWTGRTKFQRAVLTACRKVPFGQVRTYGELAALARHPRSARAVGNVMASNHTPLIIPCHRVVAAGGKLGGYSAPNGLHLKRQLLKLENAAR